MDGLGLVVDLARQVAARAYAAKQLRDDCVGLAHLVDKLCDVLQAVREMLNTSSSDGTFVQTLLQDMRTELQKANDFVEKTQRYSFLRVACQSGSLSAKLAGVKEGLTGCMTRLMGVGSMSMGATIEQRLGVFEKAVWRAFQVQARKTEAVQLEALEVDMAALHRKVQMCRAGTAGATAEQLQDELQAVAYQIRGEAVSPSELEDGLLECRSELQELQGQKQELEDLMMAQILALLDSAGDAPAAPSQAPVDDAGPNAVEEVCRRSRSEAPQHLLCPISGQLMQDPVMLVESGHTFDRRSIREWLDRGNTDCPISRRALSSCQLVPVYAMRHAVEDWIAGAPGMPAASNASSVPDLLPPQRQQQQQQQQQQQLHLQQLPGASLQQGVGPTASHHICQPTSNASRQATPTMADALVPGLPDHDASARPAEVPLQLRSLGCPLPPDPATAQRLNPGPWMGGGRISSTNDSGRCPAEVLPSKQDPQVATESTNHSSAPVPHPLCASTTNPPTATAIATPTTTNPQTATAALTGPTATSSATVDSASKAVVPAATISNQEQGAALALTKASFKAAAQLVGSVFTCNPVALATAPFQLLREVQVALQQKTLLPPVPSAGSGPQPEGDTCLAAGCQAAAAHPGPVQDGSGAVSVGATAAAAGAVNVNGAGGSGAAEKASNGAAEEARDGAAEKAGDGAAAAAPEAAAAGSPGGALDVAAGAAAAPDLAGCNAHHCAPLPGAETAGGDAGVMAGRLAAAAAAIAAAAGSGRLDV